MSYGIIICTSPRCQSSAGCICGERWPVSANQPSGGFTFTHEPGCPYLTAAGGMGQCLCTPEQKEIKRLKSDLQDARAALEKAQTKLAYLCGTGNGSDGRNPRIIDLCFTAFQQAKSPNKEDGGPSDWFNDTKPNLDRLIAALPQSRSEGT